MSIVFRLPPFTSKKVRGLARRPAREMIQTLGRHTEGGLSRCQTRVL